MNAFDSAILQLLNRFARRSWAFDEAVAFISNNDLFKGGVLMVLLWWAWYRAGERDSRDRDHMVVTLLGCAVALAVGRILVLALPFRLRPLQEIGLTFVTPYGVAEAAFAKLSSFPSDHAVLFFGLATGLFFISRAVGAFALAWTVVFVALPRMYLGLHYATDILAGAAIGSAIVGAANMLLVDGRLTRSIRALSEARPMYFYPALFIVTWQIADLFENSRAIVGGVFKLATVVVH